MPAFTKGKWSYADVSTPYEQHFIIGTVDKTGTFYAHASTKTEADARLFSAAPDMYDLLGKAFDALPNDHPLRYDIDACLCHVEGSPVPGEENYCHDAHA